MPEFSYVARNPEGEKVTGAVTAASEREALAAIAGRSLFPVEVRADAPVTHGTNVRRVPAQIRATCFSQLADLLRSGVPMLRSLAVLIRQTNHSGLKEVLQEVHRLVEDGATLAEAMGRFPRIFGEMSVSMIRAGSEGGFLEEALTRVADFTETQEDLRKRTTGALAYPVFLGVVGTLVVIVLMVFFVPKFEGLFENLRQRGELPIVTDILLTTSDLMWVYGPYLLAAIVAGAFFLSRWLKTAAGRLWLDRIRIKLPIVGKVFLSLAVARFCRVLGTLLHNGVPIVRSLEISSDATGNRVLGLAVLEASEEIAAGQSLAGPLAASGHFPPMVVEMIAVAEESNTLENVLLGIADSLERRTWRELDIAVRLIEPLMLLLLASVVLVLVIALLLPVLKMSTTI
ncbi:MAG: type II secretion system F family protein [Thermoguttaceae bacterium]|jgi:general secretion pathway protein F